MDRAIERQIVLLEHLCPSSTKSSARAIVYSTQPPIGVADFLNLQRVSMIHGRRSNHHRRAFFSTIAISEKLPLRGLQMCVALEVRLATALKENEAAEKEKLEKERSAKEALAYQESQMEMVVKESKKLEAQENPKVKRQKIKLEADMTFLNNSGENHLQHKPIFFRIMGRPKIWTNFPTIDARYLLSSFHQY
ncbi:hypothetical protein L6452_44491 [Arctium lappa]|uniref:Uncharacterized protein n=1 Tax=Arctium lappa TaxID=4217 RepID=A0ACB8XG28_ARCLA|nr:hypothetical protein L6452_44491 [Arctium lappa]